MFLLIQESSAMSSPDLNRRDFHRLTIAAMGGVLAGSAAGCFENPRPDAQKPPTDKPSDEKPVGAADSATRGDENAKPEGEPHACSGLNACKNQGASAKNDCAGQGDCATKAWYHSCGGQNDCKGQGGCGETATTNDCKGKGACHIPLMTTAWKTARKHFEEQMTADGKKFGDGTPPKKK
jgi:hypothetical protein